MKDYDEKELYKASLNLGVTIDKTKRVLEALGNVGLSASEAGRVMGQALIKLKRKENFKNEKDNRCKKQHG